MKISAVILAAGESERFGKNKLFVSLEEPLLTKVVRVFKRVEEIDEIVLVINISDEVAVRDMLEKSGLNVTVVFGGTSREDSAYIGVEKAIGDYVLIHDAARVNVTEKLIKDVINELIYSDGVIPVVNSTDSLVTENGYLDRKSVFAVQTPQGFNREKLLFAYQHAKNDLWTYTDDGSIFAEKYPVKKIQGDAANKKITFPEDVYGIAGEMVYGTGYDCHRLVEGRRLVLGGVTIPFEKGLLGVSDADVVLHALMDAMLNACGLGDIGKYFPPSDPKYQGANSVGLTLKILKLVREAGYRPSNVAVTILAEKPKLADMIPLIKENVAALCGLSKNFVGVGATTTEGLGFVGREEGIACYVVCSLRRAND